MIGYLATRLSDHIATTGEGYLVCRDAVLCRTGKQQYRGDEVGLDRADFYDVYRPHEEVFARQFLMSLEGKPIVDGHPPTFLNSANTSYYQKGHLQNVRPGPRLPDGEQSVIADLIVTDELLIAKIMNGTRNLSVGYTYDLREDERGRLAQSNLSANHVAVVPAGRAGRHVRIMDAAPEESFETTCARYHRQANPKSVSSRSAMDAIPYDPTGRPRSFDELAAELRQTFNAEKTEEAEKEKAIVSSDEENFEAMCARHHRQTFVKGR